MPNQTAFVLTHESDPQRTAKATSLIALALTRSLGRQGIPVVRIHPNRLDRSLASRYCSAVEVSPDFYASEAALLDFLLALARRYEGLRVLIPGSDDCAWFVARYHAELSAAYAVVAPPGTVMETIIDKQRQYEKAQTLGIPIPETYFPDSLEEVVELAPRLANYPYVIKPLVAHTWRRATMKGVSQGKKGFAVRNADELLGRYEEIARGDRRIMIQEVIGGADDRLYTFLSCFDAQSRPLGYCIRKKLRQLPLDFGYCTLTESCHDETVREQSLRLLAGLGYQGISGVEWKCDPHSGIYKLIEVNPRAVNTTAIAAACGVDLPAIAFRDKAGTAGEAATEWVDGVKWINFEQDIWAARALNGAGKLGWRAWWRSLSGRKVDAVFALDDLKPSVGHCLGLLRARLRRLCGRLASATGLPGGRPVAGSGTP
ncbi:ATP-grasp domain-containing protein [Dechloromonas sp. XY25]|uniref:ATP-grasp domain-containing protein n=1 Tax=Dechloromonas hankyongensis TaxID=2908002 RepID=A0ABS9K683_9RHOO|nr:ATP-grasp domain-containing protein [Dechloromonas hankyongensis]MCG2578651.1 ATP-grasp domain-containing protein [Dechloromonas hankyongensis]